MMLAAAVAVLVFGPAPADEKPVRALFVLVGAGGHNVEVNTPPLIARIKELGGIEATLLAPPAGKPGDGAHLAKLAEVTKADYDVLVFYTVGNKLDAAQEQALQKFLDEGGGIVAIHGATASFGSSKLWGEITGGRFAGHAPGTYDLLINVVDRQHPITAGVEPFVVNDEEYTYRFTDGVKRHVLAQFRERPAKTAEKNGNNDILWITERDRGRIFHSGLGHDVKAWSNPAFQKLIIQGIYWAAGRPKEVTIPK
jgi:type 1 glutamine amidotransferase